MNTKKAEKALKKIAKRDGISVREVKREIEIAVAAARENPDPKSQAFWNAIPCRGEQPTPEEVITYIADTLDDRKIKQ